MRPGIKLLEGQGLDADTSWRADALCQNNQRAHDLMFHITSVGKGAPAAAPVMRAKAICEMCDVTAQCLEYALVTEQTFGIWGGTTPQERRKM